MWYTVSIKKIEHLFCSFYGYYCYNLLCSFDNHTVKSIHIILNQKLIDKISKLKVGGVVKLKLIPSNFDVCYLCYKYDFDCIDLFF